MKKRIKLIPDNNSIAFTARKILEPCYEIIKCGDICTDNDITLVLKDNSDKIITKLLYENSKYYPSPIKNSWCIKKPINGHSSQGITYEKYDKEQLGFIYQNYIDGQEYTVDILIINRKLFDFTVRERHNIWKGISMKSIIIKKYNKKIRQILNNIIKLDDDLLFNPDAIWTVQFIRDKNNKFWLIENNKRPCANMCYGGDGNYILNYVRKKLNEPLQRIKKKPKEINRFLGWEIKE